VLFCLALTLLGTWISYPEVVRAEREMTPAIYEKLGLGQEALAEALEKMPDPDALTASDYALSLSTTGLVFVVVLLLSAFVLHALGWAFGTRARFRETLALYALALVVSAAGSLLKAVLMHAAGTIHVTLGAGALVPGLGLDSVAGRLLDVVDVPALLNLYLLALGAGIVYRVGKGFAWGLAGSFWFLRMAVAFILGLVQSSLS
jgi:hypothetical protein